MKFREKLKILREAWNSLALQTLQVNSLRQNNPDTEIARDIRIIGNPSKIRLGKGSVVDSGVVFDLHCGGSITFGEKATLRSGAIIAPYGGSIEFGNECGVQHYSIIYGHGGFQAGNYVRIAAHSVIIPANHGIERTDIPIHQQELTQQGIRFEDDIWVGSGCRILDGVVLEQGIVVASGAVVKNSFPGNTIIGGVPAKILKQR